MPLSPEELLRLANAAEYWDNLRRGPTRPDPWPDKWPDYWTPLVQAGFMATDTGVARARRVARVEMAGQSLLSQFGSVPSILPPVLVDELKRFCQALDHEEGEEK